jgi:rhodanese-related sulfurtransferase
VVLLHCKYFHSIQGYNTKLFKYNKKRKKTNGTTIYRIHGRKRGSKHSNKQIPKRIEELKNLKAPLILCCASGNRSGQAQHFLSQHGLNATMVVDG